MSHYTFMYIYIYSYIHIHTHTHSFCCLAAYNGRTREAVREGFQIPINSPNGGSCGDFGTACCCMPCAIVQQLRELEYRQQVYIYIYVYSYLYIYIYMYIRICIHVYVTTEVDKGTKCGREKSSATQTHKNTPPRKMRAPR